MFGPFDSFNIGSSERGESELNSREWLMLIQLIRRQSRITPKLFVIHQIGLYQDLQLTGQGQGIVPLVVGISGLSMKVHSQIITSPFEFQMIRLDQRTKG